MYNFFYKLSGSPKSGNIIKCSKKECIVFVMLFAVEIFFGFRSANGIFSKIIFGMVLSIFAWQLGWIMSINRFYLLNKENLYNKEIVEGIKIASFSLKMLVGIMFSCFGFLSSIKIFKILSLFLCISICWAAGWSMNITLKNDKESNIK